MPSSAPKTPAKAGAALLIALAVAISAPFTAAYEGLRTKPYPDPGNPKVMTVCYGETERDIRVYTPDECAMLLRERQANDYAPAVLKCLGPAPITPGILAALTDAAYNAGVGAVCRSPMVRKMQAGDIRGGCKAFVGWYETANGKRLKGLVRRRAAERDLCLKSVL